MTDLDKLYFCRKQYYYSQGIVLLLSFIYLYINNFEGSKFLLLALSMWNTLSYLYVFYFEVKYSPDFHPFIILALVTAQFIGLNGLSIYSDLLEGKPALIAGNDVSEMLVGGIWFLMLQHYLTFMGYDYIYRKKYMEYQPQLINYIESTDIDYYKWGIRSYIVLWVFRGIGLFINWSAISSVITSYTNEGQLITLTLFTFGKLAANESTLNKTYWTITAVEIVLVLGNGMKEEIIINLIPYAIFLFIAYKSKLISLNINLLLKLSFLGIFVLYGVFPYVSIFRSISIQRGVEWSQVSVSEVMTEYKDYIIKNGKYASMSSEELSDRSSGYAISRAGSISCNSWLVNRTLRDGSDTRFFKYCMISLVPRALWPDKPPVVVGNMMYELALGHKDWDIRAQENARRNIQVTSLAPGFVGASVMTFGFWGSLICFILPGIIIAKLWFYIKDKLSYNLIAIWLFYSIIRILLKDFEAFKDSGLVFYAMSLFYCFLIYLFPNNKYKPDII